MREIGPNGMLRMLSPDPAESPATEPLALDVARGGGLRRAPNGNHLGGLALSATAYRGAREAAD
jgi:hypothetical protein